MVQQIALGMTSKLTIGSTLPRISYLTRADRCIGSAIRVFLGLMKAVLTTVLTQGRHKRLLVS